VAVNIFILFFELGTESQYVQEVASFGGTHVTHQRKPVVQFRLDLLESVPQLSLPCEAPSFSKTSAARRASDLASSSLCCPAPQLNPQHHRNTQVCIIDRV
jgi:hypothetical protein